MGFGVATKRIALTTGLLLTQLPDDTMAILNLTQHPSSDSQAEEGVVEPSDKEAVQDLLTFEGSPSSTEMRQRADKLAAIAEEHEADAAMIGGMPAFMSALERALARKGIAPLYSFTQRKSVEVQEDGETVKKTVFSHEGWTTPKVVIRQMDHARVCEAQKGPDGWSLMGQTMW
jgi:hypothetical protein